MSNLIVNLPAEYLSRSFRYYSQSLLDSIHRSIAIDEWYNIQLVTSTHSGQPQSLSLERALGAFDLFVLHDQPGDLDDVSTPRMTRPPRLTLHQD